MERGSLCMFPCFPAVVRPDLRRGGSASSAISGSAGSSLSALGSSGTSVGVSGTGTGSVLTFPVLGTAMIISSVSDFSAVLHCSFTRWSHRLTSVRFSGVNLHGCSVDLSQITSTISSFNSINCSVLVR